MFNGFEKRLKISFAKTVRPLTLDNLIKQCWAILDRFGENLQHIAILIYIYQDSKPGKGFNIFINWSYPLFKIFIIGGRRWKEIHTIGMHYFYR